MHFVDALDQAVTSLARSHSRHLGQPSREPANRHHIELGPKGTRPDGNGVNLDEEVIALHRDSGAFISRAGILARIASLTRTGITGG